MYKIYILLISFFLMGCSGAIHNSVGLHEQLERVDQDHINRSYEGAFEWMTQNFNNDGYFNYLYNPRSDVPYTKNNMIRQLMMSRILAQVSMENKALLTLHQTNLDYIFEHWYREEGELGYVYFSEKSKLGANAMLLRVLIESPFFEVYKDQAYKIANTISAIQEDDGSFRAWYIAPEYDYDEDYLLTFYSGEAILALIEFYEKTHNNVYLEMVQKAVNYYIDAYVVNIEKNYYPAYVPWHTMALNKLYQITEDDRYAQALFILNDRLLQIQNTQRESAYYGRFYNDDYKQYGSPHSSSDAVYTEGLIYAYEIAQQLGDEGRMLLYNAAIHRSYDNLFDLQYLNREVDSQKVYGALRYNEEDDTVRVDTTSHFLDATMKYKEVFLK